MKTEAALLSAIASASTLREQASLVAELDALRQSKTARVQADRDWDAAGTVVEQTLTPVLAHSLHTASTDWLSEADIPAVDTNRVHAEAALWFGKTSAMVKSDGDEFAEQAKGIARRLASQYGEAAPEAERAFMDYVAFLLRREAASGLPQIQQTHDGKDNPSTTPLPTDTFDTFREAIDPINQGVDEMQSTENAPLLNEIIQNGQGEGQAEVANGHSTSQTFTGPRTNGAGMQVGSSLDAPSVANDYLYNLEDFLQAQAAIKTQAARESSDDQEDHTSSGDLQAESAAAPDGNAGGKVKRTPEVLLKEHRDANRLEENARNLIVKKINKPIPEGKVLTPDGKGVKRTNVPRKANLEAEAASGLDQVEQVLDNQENYDPKPLPLDVAFPLIPYFEQGKKAESVKIASSVDEMLKQQGTDNPMLDETHSGGAKKVAEPTNAMEKAVQHKSGSLSKQAAAEYRKAAAFAASWKPGQPIVRVGSPAFEAGLYAGITANAAAQEAWLAEHERWGLQGRIEAHARFTEVLQAQAGTTSDFDEMSAGNGLSDGPHSMESPINGPGSVPPLAGGMDPAAPGGAAPYNGAEPYSRPVAPDPGWVDHHKNDRLSMFQQRVQAGLQAREAAEGKSPVCRGCGEAFESRAVAEQAHGKKGCGTEDGERGYEMRKNSEAW